MNAETSHKRNADEIVVFNCGTGKKSKCGRSQAPVPAVSELREDFRRGELRRLGGGSIYLEPNPKEDKLITVR